MFFFYPSSLPLFFFFNIFFPSSLIIVPLPLNFSPLKVFRCYPNIIIASVNSINLGIITLRAKGFPKWPSSQGNSPATSAMKTRQLWSLWSPYRTRLKIGQAEHQIKWPLTTNTEEPLFCDNRIFTRISIFTFQFSDCSMLLSCRINIGHRPRYPNAIVQIKTPQGKQRNFLDQSAGRKSTWSDVKVTSGPISCLSS